MIARLLAWFTVWRFVAIFLAWCAVSIMAVLTLAVVALAIAIVQGARM